MVELDFLSFAMGLLQADLGDTAGFVPDHHNKLALNYAFVEHDATSLL